MKKLGLFFAMVTLIGLVSCEKEKEYSFVNGDYKAEMATYSNDWKEFMEVTITNDMVSAVNYDAINAEETLKSSLTDYPMADPPGLPSVWYPQLEAQYMAVDLLNYDPADIDGITGATGTSENSRNLFDLIVEAGKTGDTETQVYTPSN